MTRVQIRHAVAADIPAIVAMLADDYLGAARESLDDMARYLKEFEAIDTDPSELLVVATAEDRIVGTLQLSFMPGLSHKGAVRAQVEGVRVATGERSMGTGETLLTWAIDEARAHHCSLVQLTTDKTRTDAHRFYDRLGFAKSHEGYKLTL